VVAAALRCSNCNASLTAEAPPALTASVTGVVSISREEAVAATVAAATRASLGVPLETVTATEANVTPDIDPRLQRLIVRAQQGVRKLPTSSTGVDEVAVVARVTDVDAWEELSEVQPGLVISPDGAGDGTWLVTGRIPVRRIPHVREQPFVASLKPGQRVSTTLDSTTSEIGATPALLPASAMTDGGRNAIIGIVDFGCDYAHDNFRNADGSSRLLKIWNQNGDPIPSSPLRYGREYTKADIDAALGQPDPYAALGYAPPPDSPNEIGTHGTHVTDIAAGNGRGSGVPGVAPNADIIFVESASSDIQWSGSQVVGQSFGDSVQLLEAVGYIFNAAAGRPCVVNISLGTNGGPHDGTTLVENGIDRLIGQAPNRAVVISASNSFADGIHAAGTVPAGGAVDLVWDLPGGDSFSTELEVWYDGDDRFTLEVIAPNGASLMTVGPGENRTLTSSGRVVLLAANRLNDPNNHDNMIGVFLEQGMPAGRWTMRLHGTAVTGGGFHAWIERDDSGQSSFLPPHDSSHTLGSISCGRLTIAVGSYDAHKPTKPLSYFSSSGPTRDGREKPEISAPGHNVTAARSRTSTRTTRKSGTSMAAPAVTGVVALVLSEAQARGRSLAAAQIRDIVINTARRSPPAGTAWDQRYGLGRVSASGAVARVIALGTPGSTTSVKPTASAKKSGAATTAMKGGAKKGAAKKSAAKKGGSKAGAPSPSRKGARKPSAKSGSKGASKRRR
jgi:hypothetical protein